MTSALHDLEPHRCSFEAVVPGVGDYSYQRTGELPAGDSDLLVAGVHDEECWVSGTCRGREDGRAQETWRRGLDDLVASSRPRAKGKVGRSAAGSVGRHCDLALPSVEAAVAAPQLEEDRLADHRLAGC